MADWPQPSERPKPKPPIVHGKYSTYVKKKCRCEPCKEANRIYSRDRWRRGHNTDVASYRIVDGRTPMFLKTLTLPNGRQIQAEVVSTPEELRQGLMGRKPLNPGEGMLFVFLDSGKHTAWMANTPIALDMVWMNEAAAIVEIEHSAQPYSLKQRGGKVRSTCMLELPAGTAKSAGLQVGQTIGV